MDASAAGERDSDVQESRRADLLNFENMMDGRQVGDGRANALAV